MYSATPDQYAYYELVLASMHSTSRMLLFIATLVLPILLASISSCIPVLEYSSTVLEYESYSIL